MAASYYVVPIWWKLPSGSELRYLSNTVEVRLEEMPNHVHLPLLAAENNNYLTNGAMAFECIKASLTSDTWNRCNGNIPTLAFSKIIHKMPRVQDHTNHAVRNFIMVVKIEYYLTPEQILELALNQAYYGRNTYGITQAAKFYFDKAPAQLNLAQSALLAGLIKAPTRYSPFSNTERSLERRNRVLEMMVVSGMITKKESAAALAEPLNLSH